MKIKAVCEETGLTDRAVRYYIDEGLIKPEFTENYVGRRSYDFTFEDISLLSDISTLRKFGFTVAEIKDIILNPQSSCAVIQKVRERTYHEIQNNTAAISVLEKMDFSKPYTLPELAAELEAFTRFAPLPAEDNRLSNRAVVRVVMYTIAGILGALLFLPFMVFISGSISLLSHYEYLTFDIPMFCLSVFLILSPVITVLIFKYPARKKRVIGVLRSSAYVLSYFCMLGGILLLLVVSFNSASETNDMKNYLDFGKDRDVGRQYSEHIYVLELFPDVPFEDDVTVDSKYHYLCMYDPWYVVSDFEIYAEWTLDKETFESEVQRIKDGFGEREDIHLLECGDFTVIAQTKDLFRFEMYDWSSSSEIPYPEDYDGQSDCNFFAYNEESHTVRYYWCGSSLRYVRMFPYYAELEW